MPTEREVLQQIIHDDPEGIPNLFERHAALFREGLLRFFEDAGEGRSESLARVMGTMAQDLKARKFNDIVETFYDWVVRNAWGTLMAIRMEEEGGEHLEPNHIYESSDRLNEAALPEEVRAECKAHFAECPLCRGFLERCKTIAVQVRHAGAPHGVPSR